MTKREEEQQVVIDTLLEAMKVMGKDNIDRRAFLLPLAFLLAVGGVVIGLLLCHVSSHGRDQLGSIENRGNMLPAPPP